MSDQNKRAGKPRVRVPRQVAQMMSDMIHSGKLPPGSLLPSERDLVAQFRVSRTSIREALLNLQGSGLVEVRDRARARVVMPTHSTLIEQLGATARALLAHPEGVMNFQELRTVIECGLARHGATYASNKDLERLARALEQNRRAIGDVKRFAESDAAFHRSIAELPHNPIFPALQEAFIRWMDTHRTAGMKTRGAMRHAYGGHKAIYEAIAARDARGADAAMAEHVRWVTSTYRKAAERRARLPQRRSAATGRQVRTVLIQDPSYRATGA